ncbi:MAG: signal peptidase II [bacterium]|nr:signal peptidase II [Bacillota bacterium]HHW54179.1 signal peptidase II [Bacillota bacterium]
MAVYLIGLLVLFFDQLTKFWVQNSMLPRDSIPLIPGVFHLTYVQNTGAAFGFLRGKTLFFIVVAVLVLGFIIFLAPRLSREKPLLGLVFGLLLGGALGNLIDRIRFGYVIDFLDFRVWPVFNIADMAIVVGVCFLIWEIWFRTPEGI